ncbi:hypothetical protein CEJ86_33385, partial [Sinorhizobium meliloti]
MPDALEHRPDERDPAVGARRRDIRGRRPRIGRLAVLCGVALCCLSPPGLDRAKAQGEGADEGARAPAILAVPGSSAAAGMVDESALRYYASQKQTARMKAEAARLKRLYPGW